MLHALVAGRTICWYVDVPVIVPLSPAVIILTKNIYSEGLETGILSISDVMF
jgi:hypothetical protein